MRAGAGGGGGAEEESTQGFGGEGELRAGRNGGERPTAEWASLGKQKGLRGHIQLSQELRLEMRGDCGRSWRLRAGFGQVVAWLIGLGGGREDYVQCAAARLQEQNGSLLHMDSFGAIPRVERNVLACPTLKEPASL